MKSRLPEVLPLVFTLSAIIALAAVRLHSAGKEITRLRAEISTVRRTVTECEAAAERQRHADREEISECVAHYDDLQRQLNECRSLDVARDTLPEDCAVWQVRLRHAPQNEYFATMATMACAHGGER